MSDLSSLSSIGGTLSALQDTGLREFIKTNSGSWTGGGAGTEYSAGANINITDNVISGKDWTSEITAVANLIPNSIPIKLLTTSVNTSEITYGDLRALCNGTQVFYVKVPDRPIYGSKIYHLTRCSDFGSHCEVCFTSEQYSPRDEEGGEDMSIHNYYEANISFFIMDAKDDGPADTDIAIIGTGWAQGVFTQGSINPDWNITDTLNPRYIKNKPDLSTYATNTELSSVSGTLQTEIETVSGNLTGYLSGDFSGTGQPLTFTNKDGKLLYNDKMVLNNDGLSAHTNYNFGFYSDLRLNVYSGISAYEGDIYNLENAWGLNSAGVYYDDNIQHINWSGIKNTDIALDGDNKISAISGHELKSVDLTPYQTTAGMTAYIPATVVATSADATGSNILYVVTGE